ncbi:MAG: dCTP deaminase [Candidatus Ancillula sp.]|jgi:dCTP deaminase|nr:dCTP deaminase [Candidatus Ancillula sp.]
MLLSDRDIKSSIRQKEITLEPFSEAMVQPSSIDVRLDGVFCKFDNNKYTHIDPAVKYSDLTQKIVLDDSECYILHPGEFVLGSTYELITLGTKVAARFEGKSSLGRLGLATHITAGFIDPGFSGHITLELSNLNILPIKLYPGMKIGQLAFFELSSEVEFPYGSAQKGSHYQNQRGPTPSRIYDNFHIVQINN